MRCEEEKRRRAESNTLPTNRNEDGNISTDDSGGDELVYEKTITIGNFKDILTKINDINKLHKDLKEKATTIATIINDAKVLQKRVESEKSKSRYPEESARISSGKKRHRTPQP